MVVICAFMRGGAVYMLSFRRGRGAVARRLYKPFFQGYEIMDEVICFAIRHACGRWWEYTEGRRRICGEAEAMYIPVCGKDVLAVVPNCFEAVDAEVEGSGEG